MAYALAYYLSSEGCYEGFDIVTPWVQWANDTISRRFPNCRFRVVDIHNGRYNPTGTLQSTEFAFPYPDANFDFVFLTSVFTHMRPDEIRHYLDEISRVLRPGGRCMCTCFLMNDEAQTLLAGGQARFNIVHELDGFYTSSLEEPEEAIAFREPVLLDWIDQRGFDVKGKHYGLWCGRTRYTTFQDVLVLEKR